jgi:hypothetical protein
MKAGHRHEAQFTALVLSMLLSMLVLASTTWAAPKPIRVGAGIYGVYGLPVLQEDAGAGPLYGAKLRADLFGPFGAEAFYTAYQEGDVTVKAQLGNSTLKGGNQTAFGVNLVMGTTGASGVRIYLTGGVASYTLTKDYRADLTRLGYNGGLGLEFRSKGPIAIDLSGRVHAVTLADGGTRKFAALQAGINFYFIR